MIAEARREENSCNVLIFLEKVLFSINDEHGLVCALRDSDTAVGHFLGYAV